MSVPAAVAVIVAAVLAVTDSEVVNLSPPLTVTVRGGDSLKQESECRFGTPRSVSRTDTSTAGLTRAG